MMKSGVFGILALLVAACSVPTSEPEAITSQAAERDNEVELFCAECFEETSSGGGGSRGEGGRTNGFVGGVIGWAAGAARGGRERAAANPGECPPGMDCVEVKGQKGPLEDSKLRVIIRSGEREVYADVPRSMGRPERVDGDKKPCSPERVGGLQCVDLLRMCEIAARTEEGFEDFIQWLSNNTNISWLNLVRLRSGAFRSEQVRLNLCYAVFGT